MEIDLDQVRKLEAIFMPTLVERRKHFYDADPQRKARLAHYTSAENAVNIIRSQSLWLRNARGMQDYSETRYGHKLGHDYFADQNRLNQFVAKFQRANFSPANAGIELFNNSLADLNFGTYLACFSEHGTDCEPHGRLSMWRSFGQSTARVALIFNAPVPYTAMPLAAGLSPVLYPRRPEEYWSEFDKILHNVDANQAYLQTVQGEMLAGWIYATLLMHAVSLKHDAFEEEREWRLCHFPGRVPSPHVSKLIKSLNGIPQVVYEVPLRNNPEQGINGVSLPELLHSVKIGPTQHRDVIWQALVNAMQEVGIADAAEKVTYSQIPLKDWTA